MPGSAARRTSLLGEVRLQQRAAERARLGVRGVPQLVEPGSKPLGQHTVAA